MDLKQIENIVMIEKEGSISKAADRLYITQSALNQQLLHLEKELGVSLFDRVKRSMVPTMAGRIYLENAHRILSIRDQTYKRISDISHEKTGEISITYTPERGSRMFQTIFPVFHLLYPHIVFRIKEARNKEMETLLENREVDLACLSYRSDNRNPLFSYIKGAREEYILGVPASHPMVRDVLPLSSPTAPLPTLDLRKLADSPFILSTEVTRGYDMEQEMLRTAGITPPVLFKTQDSSTRLAMVRQQIASAFFPQAYMDLSAPIRYFHCEPFPAWTTCVAFRKDDYLTVPELVLADLIRKYNVHALDHKGILYSK